MSLNSPFSYFTVDLFLYDLAESLGESDAEIKQRRERFWQRIYDSPTLSSKLPALERAEQQFSGTIKLLGNQAYEAFAPPWDGYFYPLKLNDVYALLVDCSGKKDDEAWEQLDFCDRFIQTQRKVIEAAGENTSLIGRSWFIWGHLTKSLDEKQRLELARSCYEQLEFVPHKNWQRDYKGKGKWGDAFLFAIEQQDSTPDLQNNSYHIIFCFFPPSLLLKEEIFGKMIDLQAKLFRLFHYHHKILWAYEQGYALKSNLKKSSGIVETLIESLNKNIKTQRLDLQTLQENLAAALSTSFIIQRTLGLIEEQAENLKTNANNYELCWQEIAKMEPKCDLEFFKTIGEYGRTKNEGLQRDRATLNASLKPLNDFIQTAKGIIEIEQTKNERTFNKTVAIATVGVSTASLTASTFPFEQAKNVIGAFFPAAAKTPAPPNYIGWSVVLTFSTSLLVGLVSAGITAALLSRRQRY